MAQDEDFKEFEGKMNKNSGSFSFLDHALDDGNPQRGKPKIPGVYEKEKTKGKASLRNKIDLSSLLAAGITTEKAKRLQRALYVHSIGFYNLLKEVTSQCQNKKDVIVGVFKILFSLIEMCEQSHYKMLVLEVAKQYEEENKI